MSGQIRHYRYDPDVSSPTLFMKLAGELPIGAILWFRVEKTANQDEVLMLVPPDLLQDTAWNDKLASVERIALRCGLMPSWTE